MNNYFNLDLAGSNLSKNSPSTIGCACNDHQINIKVLISDCKSIFDSYILTEINSIDILKGTKITGGVNSKVWIWQCRINPFYSCRYIIYHRENVMRKLFIGILLQRCKLEKRIK